MKALSIPLMLATATLCALSISLDNYILAAINAVLFVLNAVNLGLLRKVR